MHALGAHRPRFVSQDLGPATILALVLGTAALWLLVWPAGVPGQSYVGQLIGAESVLLLSIALVLISTLPWIETYFDGIDRAAIWHRRVAITGVALLLPHILLASNPDGGALGGPLGLIGLLGLAGLALWAILPRWRSVVPRFARPAVEQLRELPGADPLRDILGGYERWRFLHRTTGLFVAAGFVHGLLDQTPFDEAPSLRWSYVVTGGVGVAFYVYRELLADRFLSLHDFQVETVTPAGPGLTEIALRPLGRRMEFAPGQFAMVYLEGKDGWHRHPFTIASAPRDPLVRFTIKALGDYTSRLPELIEPGMPAVLSGPHGRFDHRRGAPRQLWIAGGVGIAPFLSWLRALDGHDGPHVDLFYANDGPAPFAAEIAAINARNAWLTASIRDTGADGRVGADEILAATNADPRSLSVFMCGPQPMLRSYQLRLLALGVRPRRIHREYFDWR
jgi:predicted ferric reductase